MENINRKSLSEFAQNYIHSAESGDHKFSDFAIDCLLKYESKKYSERQYQDMILLHYLGNKESDIKVNIENLPIELKDSIAIAETGGRKISPWVMLLELRVDVGIYTSQQAREIMFEYYACSDKGQ